MDAAGARDMGSVALSLKIIIEAPNMFANLV
jgi:hypothetical protein